MKSNRGPRKLRHQYQHMIHRGRISYARAKQIENTRSKKAIETDLRINATKRYAKGEKDYSDWLKDPAHSDIAGLDTIPQRQEVWKKELPEMRPEVITRKEFEHTQRTNIEPFVRNEFKIWKDQHRDSKHKLTMLGLQKYYDSREAAFEAEGGTPTSFKDAFDKVDVAIASDSWRDLDSELKRANIFASDVSEMKRRAKETANQDRRIAHEYEQYRKSEEKKHAAAG